MTLLPRKLYAGEAWYGVERERLAERTWQMLGVVDHLRAHNDYVRREVLGVDVFVQNFNGELRGYHNVCSHRGFPVRREPSGNAPLQCGFHGWVFNRDGVPTGIPRNRELFEISRERQTELALKAVRVETIGRFVFVSLAENPPPLQEYLGEHAAPLEAFSTGMRELFHHETRVVSANWKFCVEITLEDYHADAVHPTTFGKGGPVPLVHYVYKRAGAHSSYMRRRDADWSFDGFWQDLERGVADRTGYKIFNTFPNLLCAVTPWNSIVTMNRPLGPNTTEIESWIFDWTENPLGPTERKSVIDFLSGLLPEDHVVCAAQQTVADAEHRFGRRSDALPVLGKLEERIGWFQESYTELLGPIDR